MNQKNRKTAAGTAAVVVTAWVLAGCVSVEFPNVVSDTAKAGREAYQAYRASKAPVKAAAVPASAPVPAATLAATPVEYVQNTYVGQETQTVAEIKRLCVEEAGAKLTALLGRPATYTVAENAVQTIQGATVANCRLVVTAG